MAKQALHVLGANDTPQLLTSLPNVSWTLSLANLLVTFDPCPAGTTELLLYHQILHKKGHVPLPWLLWLIGLSSKMPFYPMYRMWASKFAFSHSAAGSLCINGRNGTCLCAPFANSLRKKPYMSYKAPIPCTWLLDTLQLIPLVSGSKQMPPLTLSTSFVLVWLTSITSLASPFYQVASSQQQIIFKKLLLGCLSSSLWESLQQKNWLSYRITDLPTTRPTVLSPTPSRSLILFGPLETNGSRNSNIKHSYNLCKMLSTSNLYKVLHTPPSQPILFSRHPCQINRSFLFH